MTVEALIIKLKRTQKWIGKNRNGPYWDGKKDCVSDIITILEKVKPPRKRSKNPFHGFDNAGSWWSA